MRNTDDTDEMTTNNKVSHGRAVTAPNIAPTASGAAVLQIFGKTCDRAVGFGKGPHGVDMGHFCLGVRFC